CADSAIPCGRPPLRHTDRGGRIHFLRAEALRAGRLRPLSAAGLADPGAADLPGVIEVTARSSSARRCFNWLSSSEGACDSAGLADAGGVPAEATLAAFGVCCDAAGFAAFCRNSNGFRAGTIAR